MKPPDEIEIVAENRVYENAYGCLYDDQVRFSASNARGTYVRWEWKAPYAVAVLPILDNGRAILLENFRHSARCRVLEVPKGFGESGVEPHAMAERELREEAGLECEELEYIGVASNDPSFSACPMHLFLAHGCSETSGSQEISEAIVRTHQIPLQALKGLLEIGISDTTSLLLILHAREFFGR